jgi:chromosome partitioning protein
MTAKVITVFNQKGGCGKTTIAMSLAGAMALRGYMCLVVDMDPQGTAIRWASAAPEERAFPASVMSLAPMEGKMHREVKNHMQVYDAIFIDCPPAMNSAAPTSAMLVSDLALIPVVPSPADIWAAESAKKLAEAAQATNESLVACVVANMVQKSTSLARDLLEILQEDNEFPLLKSSLGSRAAFREAQIIGSTVHLVPRSKAAIDEVEKMTDEVLALIQLPRTKARSHRP